MESTEMSNEATEVRRPKPLEEFRDEMAVQFKLEMDQKEAPIPDEDHLEVIDAMHEILERRADNSEYLRQLPAERTRLKGLGDEFRAITATLTRVIDLINTCRDQVGQIRKHGIDFEAPYLSRSDSTISLADMDVRLNALLDNASTWEFICLAQIHPALRKKEEKELRVMAEALDLDDQEEYLGLYEPTKIVRDSVDDWTCLTMESLLSKHTTNKELRCGLISAALRIGIGMEKEPTALKQRFWRARKRLKAQQKES